MAPSRTLKVQKKQIAKSENKLQTPEEILLRIESLLTQQNRLLMLLAAKPEIGKLGREAQISLLANAGIRQIDLSKFFGITPQAVQNAIKKYKNKK